MPSHLKDVKVKTNLSFNVLALLVIILKLLAGTRFIIHNWKEKKKQQPPQFVYTVQHYIKQQFEKDSIFRQVS
jgi:hypothetical protein